MLNLPPGPSLTTTRLGMFWPGPKLRLDASGGAVPVGNAVRYEPAVASVAVMLTTTAEAPVDGTSPLPAAWTSMLELGPTGLCVVRVSRMRAGDRATNVPFGSWVTVGCQSGWKSFPRCVKR